MEAKGGKAMLLSSADMEVRSTADKQSHGRDGDFKERERKPECQKKHS